WVTSAFRYLPGSGILALDENYTMYSTNAYATNRDGSLAAGMAQTSVDVQAFRWNRVDGIQLMGDLPGGQANGSARGMSADGSIIVGVGSSDPSYGSCSTCTEAWVWTEGTGMVGLGDLPGGTFNSAAVAISADGAVIVGTGTTDAG